MNSLYQEKHGKLKVKNNEGVKNLKAILDKIKNDKILKPIWELQKNIENYLKDFNSLYTGTLDNVDETCKKIGAVNTVLNDDGILRGFNTDMDGFLEPIKRKEIQIKNSKIFLLGAGGASRAIIAGFQKEGADNVVIAIIPL